jgi:membrane protein
LARTSPIAAIAKQTITEYIDDDGLRLSASLAFYSVLSLAPMLVFALALAETLFDTSAARLELASYLTTYAGPQATEAVLAILESASQSSEAQFATLAGLLVLIFGATASFAELQSGLNAMWRIDSLNPIRGFLRRRLVALALVFVITALLMVSVVVATVISVVAGFVRTGSYVGETSWFVLHQATSLAAFTLLFATMFRLLPSERIPWRRVWIGAAFTAVLFLIGKYLIRVYLEQASLESSYGAAGSLVALLLWIYYSAIIFYLGAKLTSVLWRRHSDRMP